MKTIMLLLSSTLLTGAENTNLYKWSVGAFVGASAVDTATSYGLVERNPILGRGEFGARQIATKVGLTGALLGVQWLCVRRWPTSRRAWTVFNFGASGVLGAAAGHNIGERR